MIRQGGLSFAETWMAVKPSRHDDFIRLIQLAEFTPLVKLLTVSQNHRHTPRPADTDVSFPIFEAIDPRKRPPLHDLAGD